MWSAPGNWRQRERRWSGRPVPFCQTMFRDAFGQLQQAPPKLLDIAQIAAASLQ